MISILHFLTALFHKVKDRRNANNKANGYHQEAHNSIDGHNGDYVN